MLSAFLRSEKKKMAETQDGGDMAHQQVLDINKQTKKQKPL